MKNGPGLFGFQKESPPRQVFDLGVAWNWEYDQDFISQLNDTALTQGLRPYLV